MSRAEAISKYLKGKKLRDSESSVSSSALLICMWYYLIIQAEICRAIEAMTHAQQADDDSKFKDALRLYKAALKEWESNFNRHLTTHGI